MNYLNKGIRCRSPSHSTKLVAVNVSSMFSFPMFRIINSNVFEAIGVRDIGLTCLSIVFGGTGITYADFHVSGVISSHNELLKIAVK